MHNNTIIIIRNRNDKDRLIKDAIFAFSGGKKSLLIKGEGQEISTAVEVAEIIKHRMSPQIEISKVSLGSRPFFERRPKYNQKYNNNRRPNNKRHKDLVSKIEITLSTKPF